MKKTLRILSLTLVAVMVSLALVSCGGPNADPDKALESLKDNGYTAAKDKLIPSALKLIGVDGIDCVVAGTKTADGKADAITIVYFEEASDAKDGWEKVKDYAEEALKDSKDFVCEKSGKMIYFGTKDAVKAAK